MAMLGGCAGPMRAARLVRDALRPPEELEDRVDERAERVAGVRVTLHRPRGVAGPLPAVVLCHGVAEEGAEDPRLIALARALALGGALVAVPHLESLRASRADPEDPARLAAVAATLADDPQQAAGGRVALLGISIGGSYALLAAARPAVRERISCVLSFGGYEDLGRLLTSWLVRPARGAPGVPEPLVEGRRLVLLGNVDRLVPDEDRATMRRVLKELLAGERVSPAAAAGLSPGGRRLFSCALSTGPIDPGTARALLAPMAGALRALSPGRDGRAPLAPVFLLHGANDPIIPAREAELLRARLEPLGAKVDLLVTGVFAHAGAEQEAPSLIRAWPLLRFLARFLAAAGI
jgi:dienelactone hydrolase